MLALCEVMIKKGRCSVSGNGPLMFPRQLDVVADAAFVDGALNAKSSFRKCGEKSKLAEHSPILGNKTAGRGSLKQRSGRPILVFHRTSGFSAHSALDVPTSSKKVLKAALKLHLARVDSVQYACLTMANVELKGGVRYGSAGCWQYRIC